MKKNYRLFTLISALAGYVETVFFIWFCNDIGLDRILGREGFDPFFFSQAFVILTALGMGVVNLLLWGGFGLEQLYAKKHTLKRWHVPAFCIIPGIVLNIIFIGAVVLALLFFVGANILVS